MNWIRILVILGGRWGSALGIDMSAAFTYIRTGAGLDSAESRFRCTIVDSFGNGQGQ